MQVNKVNANLPIQDNTKQNNINNLKSYQKPSFKGVDSFCLGLGNAIENGGLAVSFTLQDMLGTNLPRPYMGLMRNKKENNGHTNKSFAMKEAVREFLTGPSMFIIPMGMLGFAKNVFGSASNIPAKFINAFGNIHANNAVKNNEITGKQDFFKNTFAEIIKNAKGEETISEETNKKAQEYAKKLTESIKTPNNDNLSTRIKQWYTSVKTGQKFGVDKTIAELSDDFVNISKSHAKNSAHTDFTVAKVGNTASSFKNTVAHMVAYATDVVEKTKSQTPETAKNFIENLKNKKVAGRFALNLLMYSSVIAFLQVIPKLYNNAEGKKNSGLKGLMQEETFNDKVLNETEDKKNINKNKQDKANPSFGSWASTAQKITGNGKLGKFASTAEFDGCNLSFPFLLGLMGGGILYPRLQNAKDKYDREEILRRDVISCTVMCFAEKELRKAFSKLNEIKSGLVLASKDENFKNMSLPRKVFEYLRPIEGVTVLSTDQIRAKYTNIDQYKDGVKGFCDFVSEQGGNLGKVFGLTETSKSIVNGLLQKEGKDIATADNKTITEVLDKAKGSEEIKKLTDLFKDKDNAWVKKARTLNARFTALSILVLVPVFLGFLLPAINEHYTKKRISKELADKKAKETNNIQDFSYINKEINKNTVFADMGKYSK